MINNIISLLSLFFLILGALDYIGDNRFGIGTEFQHGLMTCGQLILCMSGFMVLAPVLANILSPILSPFFRAIGADPSLFAGIVLANDSGGAPLAMQLAQSPDAGRYNGFIVASMLGTTIMFIIPVTMSSISPDKRDAAIYGLLCGILTIPAGCFIGGLIGGFSFSLLIKNTFPILCLSVFLALMLIFFRQKIVSIFSILGKIIISISILGLILGSIELLTNHTLVPGMESLESTFAIIGHISIFLAGIFPLIKMFQKICARPFKKIGAAIGINNASISGLLTTLANALPAIALLNDMDDRGRMYNTAFLVSASCVFGDHLAYTSQAAPTLIPSMIIGKLIGGCLAILLAVLLEPVLMKQPEPEKASEISYL